MISSREIRELFTGFFAERGHRRIPSSSLIPPPEERTLLFANAGMNQMKPYFMGLSTPPGTRLTSIQKCFRTSDIEEVGDNRHCTFFEMLGNFSVGDYFKPEVIPWFWQLLTDKQPKGLGLDPSRIWPTVFTDDDESYELWHGAGVPYEHITRYGEDYNYWFMIKGGAGPCGPNTEFNYDFGAYEGWEPHDDCHPQCERRGCRRFIELGNLVFMTLFQDEDGSRRPLPQRNVDTGSGLERWPVPVLWQDQVDWQGRPHVWKQPPTIFDTDLFQPILARVGELAGKSYYDASDEDQRAMRVVAEHARAATFLIADGVTPSNEGRGYVLRRLIRRGTSFGQRLNQGQEFLARTAEAVLDHMQDEHDTLKQQREFVLKSLQSEETRFFETLFVGRRQLDEFKERHANTLMIEGREVFALWDTHGFPPELTLELLAEDGYSVADPDSFETLMAEQRARSRAGAKFEADGDRLQLYGELDLPHTEFVGYDTTRAFGSVSAIIVDGETVVRNLLPGVAANRRVEVVLTQSPFYPEGGGQVGDSGEIVWPEGGRFVVDDTQSVGEGGVIAHIGHLASGSLSVGDPVEARVDESLRSDIMRNHTATHILHAALRQVIGTHVRQAGSLVTPERLRFDFTNLEALTPEQIRTVEGLANKAVRENLPVSVDYLSYEDALKAGALAFFGDKYADTVRVVGVCDLDAGECFSKELCGGTHAHASGDVGSIIITQETSIGAGLRRLEAVTGRAASERVRVQEETVGRLSAVLRVPAPEVESRVSAMQARIAELEKQLQVAERQLARSQVGSDIVPDMYGDTAVIVLRVDAATSDALREAADFLKAANSSSVIVLAAVVEGKPAFLAMSTPDVAKRIPAGDIVRVAAKEAGGGGGGRPEIAQGGGTDVGKIDAALAAARKLIEEKLGP